MSDYYIAKYDTLAGGSFVEKGANITWTGGVGFLIDDIAQSATTGTLYIAIVSGVPPTDTLVLTQGGVTASADGDAILSAYPSYLRDDGALAGSGACTWVGPLLGTTHSFYFDGQTANVVAGEILTFSGGETCEVMAVIADNGADGELGVRFISNIDISLPSDNDTFTGDISGDGTVNGVIHPRAYSSLEIHRWLQDLNDDGDIDVDDISRIDPTASGKDTDKIINLLGSVNINDEFAQHMFDGSISQANGDTLYAGANIQVTSPNADTQPVLFQDDSIITDYWKNAFMPHSIDGNIRILKKVRDDGVDIDGKRLQGKLLEFGHSYFIGGTTLGVGVTALALFSSPDGNNQTIVGTVSGYAITETEGLQLIDFNNGNGDTEFGYSFDYATQNALESYERTKYIQRRGTAETLFGARNAQLAVGINMNFAYTAETANFSENELLAWGTEVTYSGQVTSMSVGEVVTFSPSGAKGRLLYDNDAGATGVLIIDLEGSIIPTATDTMTGVTSGGDGDVDSVVSNSTSGKALLIALDDDGTTGNVYCQQLTGLLPVSDQEMFGVTSNSVMTINGAVASRTINNQYIGVFTGTNFQTNFGLATDPTDAIVGDKLRNLADVQQEPPNNQQGVVTGLKLGDTVTCYPWDGASYDAVGDAQPTLAEATLTTALVAGVSTTAIVTAIPDNTPASGFIRVERDSDNNMDLVEYSSYSGLTYTLVGTAPSASAIGNNVMRAFMDKEMTADGSASYTAVKGATSTQVAIKVQNGYTAVKNGPIKPYPTTATFGTTGFSVGATRTSDA